MNDILNTVDKKIKNFTKWNYHWVLVEIGSLMKYSDLVFYVVGFDLKTREKSNGFVAPGEAGCMLATLGEMHWMMIRKGKTRTTRSRLGQEPPNSLPATDAALAPFMFLAKKVLPIYFKPTPICVLRKHSS